MYFFQQQHAFREYLQSEYETPTHTIHKSGLWVDNDLEIPKLDKVDTKSQSYLIQQANFLTLTMFPQSQKEYQKF